MLVSIFGHHCWDTEYLIQADDISSDGNFTQVCLQLESKRSNAIDTKTKITSIEYGMTYIAHEPYGIIQNMGKGEEANKMSPVMNPYDIINYIANNVLTLWQGHTGVCGKWLGYREVVLVWIHVWSKQYQHSHFVVHCHTSLNRSIDPYCRT